MVKRKKYVIGLIIMFIIGCLLASGIYAYASSVKFKMSIQLSPTIYFTMHLNKFTDTNDNNILDNTESKTLNSDVCIFSNVDSVTANTSYARVNGLTITLILNDDLRLQNETEKYILTVTNYNTGKYMLFEMLTSDNNAFETTPTTLKNIAVPSGQNYYNKSMVIESKALQEVNYIFNVYAEIYDTAIVEHTVNNGSYNVAYVGEDYEVDLTPSNSNMCVVVDSVKLGETTLNVNTDYNFDQVTNVLTIYKESLSANNNNNITITTTEKPKFVSTTLTLDGCSARFDNKIYHDKTNNSISNIQSTQNMAFLFTPSDADYLKWTFTVQLNGSEIYYTWDYSSKVLSIGSSEIVGDLVITAKAEIKYWSGVPGTQFAGGSGTETDPFLIEDGEQLAYLAEITNSQATTVISAGVQYTISAGCENSYFQMTNNIYLNDETFEFQDDTGLVKVTDGKNTCYLGTGAPGDDSGTSTMFDETASSRGIFYDSSFNELTVTATDTTTSYLNGGIIHTWTPIGKRINDSFDKVQASDFYGMFNGFNYSIQGRYVNYNFSSQMYTGIFGRSFGLIENLISGIGYINGYRYDGGIVASNCGEIKCCINYITILGGDNNGVGGITGESIGVSTNVSDAGLIKNCINYGLVAKAGQLVGGIAGKCGFDKYVGYIVNSFNYGKIYATGSYAGGICGSLSLPNCDITNSQNYGEVTSTGDYCGGVVGSNTSGTVSNCENNGEVTSSGDYCGGVVGRNASGLISDCVNNGDVTVTYSNNSHLRTGGIVGRNENRTASADSVVNCVNYGNVHGVKYVGGIAGESYNFNIVENCENYGAISVTPTSENSPFPGGIVGSNAGIVDYCMNYGSVYGKRYAGGITGLNLVNTSVSNGNALVANCANYGDISAETYVGGITGTSYGFQVSTSDGGCVVNCINLGNLTGITSVGGVSGTLSYGKINNCVNIGQITANGVSVGSVVGNNAGSISNSYYLFKCLNDSETGYGVGTATANSSVDNGTISKELSYIQSQAFIDLLNNNIKSFSDLLNTAGGVIVSKTDLMTWVLDSNNNPVLSGTY